MVELEAPKLNSPDQIFPAGWVPTIQKGSWNLGECKGFAKRSTACKNLSVLFFSDPSDISKGPEKNRNKTKEEVLEKILRAINALAKALEKYGMTNPKVTIDSPLGVYLHSAMF